LEILAAMGLTLPAALDIPPVLSAVASAESALLLRPHAPAVLPQQAHLKSATLHSRHQPHATLSRPA